MLIIKGGEPVPEPVTVPTSSFGINYALGGGFWSGRFNVLWGNPQSGKSTMCLQTMANAQKMGYTPVIIDAEGSYTDEWAERNGIDCNDRLYLRENVLEGIMEQVLPLMRDGQKMSFLFDSINAIEFAKFFEKDESGAAIGAGARARRHMFMKMSEYLHPQNHFVFIISQQQVEIGNQGGRIVPKLTNAEMHWSANIIKLYAGYGEKNINFVKETGLIESRKITWAIDKSKQTQSQGMKGEYMFYPAEAKFDQAGEIVECAIQAGMIAKNGSWFNLPSGAKVQGFEKIAPALGEDGLKEIVNTLLEAN